VCLDCAVCECVLCLCTLPIRSESDERAVRSQRLDWEVRISSTCEALVNCLQLDCLSQSGASSSAGPARRHDWRHIDSAGPSGDDPNWVTHVCATLLVAGTRSGVRRYVVLPRTCQAVTA